MCTAESYAATTLTVSGSRSLSQSFPLTWHLILAKIADVLACSSSTTSIAFSRCTRYGLKRCTGLPKILAPLLAARLRPFMCLVLFDTWSNCRVDSGLTSSRDPTMRLWHLSLSPIRCDVGCVCKKKKNDFMNSKPKFDAECGCMLSDGGQPQRRSLRRTLEPKWPIASCRIHPFV